MLIHVDIVGVFYGPFSFIFKAFSSESFGLFNYFMFFYLYIQCIKKNILTSFFYSNLLMKNTYPSSKYNFS